VTRDHALHAVTTVLLDIAPDVDLQAIDPSARLRDEADIDSMDFLKLLTGLKERTGVEVPEQHYEQVTSLDGLLACRILKSNEKTKSIPIVMLTARSQQLEELRGWESGADEYLTKPCDHKQLLGVLAQFLSKAGKERL